MNRRDALKTFAAVAAGGIVPSAGAVAPKMSQQQLRNLIFVAMVKRDTEFDGRMIWPSERR